VPVRQKVVLRFLHANDLKSVDSLQPESYALVMSITQFSRYEPAGKAQ
jgi:hypothetical protein